MSIGRRPLSDELLAEGTGSRSTNASCPRRRVDRTGAAGVFALGDLVPHRSWSRRFRERFHVKQILGERAIPVDYGKVPGHLLSSRGRLRRDDRAGRARRRIETVTKRDPFAPTAAPAYWARRRAREGDLREEAERRGGRLLGVHMAGPWVTEHWAGVPVGELGSARRDLDVRATTSNALRDLRRDCSALTGRACTLPDITTAARRDRHRGTIIADEEGGRRDRLR